MEFESTFPFSILIPFYLLSCRSYAILLSCQKNAVARILITSGPTRQFIDPVRYLTNASSGRMGRAREPRNTPTQNDPESELLE